MKVKPDLLNEKLTREIIGFDENHVVFDVRGSDGNYDQLKNALFGFEKFVKLT